MKYGEICCNLLIGVHPGHEKIPQAQRAQMGMASI